MDIACHYPIFMESTVSPCLSPFSTQHCLFLCCELVSECVLEATFRLAVSRLAFFPVKFIVKIHLMCQLTFFLLISDTLPNRNSSMFVMNNKSSTICYIGGVYNVMNSLLSRETLVLCEMQFSSTVPKTSSPAIT